MAYALIINTSSKVSTMPNIYVSPPKYFALLLLQLKGITYLPPFTHQTWLMIKEHGFLHDL
jgi:hypothetical protein